MTLRGHASETGEGRLSALDRAEEPSPSLGASKYVEPLWSGVPLYVTLYKLTDQGRKTIKDSPKRLRETTARLEKSLGVKIHHALYTSGRYDLVVVSEAPNDQVANSAALSIMSSGNVVGETLHAYSVDEVEKLVSKLP